MVDGSQAQEKLTRNYISLEKEKEKEKRTEKE
jgi:hypothetical protein